MEYLKQIRHDPALGRHDPVGVISSPALTGVRQMQSKRHWKNVQDEVRPKVNFEKGRSGIQHRTQFGHCS